MTKLLVWLFAIQLAIAVGMARDPQLIRQRGHSEPAEAEPSFKTEAERGLWLMLNKAYLPPDFDQETFDALWKVWPEPLRKQAEQATPDERRKLAYERYGLVARPGDPQQRPLQYVVSKTGQWSMNCFACHQGQLDGVVYPGLANQAYNMHTLYEEVRATKLLQTKALTHMDVGSMFLPLSTSRGTTNAVMFGVVLLNYREPDLSVNKKKLPATQTNHDHDAPAWWNYHLKETIYCDGFASKNPRALMQFLLVEQNGPGEFAAFEQDFRAIHAWLESLRPPKYPHPIDQELATRGSKLFTQNCQRCHGTYGEKPKWPARMVKLDDVGTDPTRLRGLTVPQRDHYGKSWFAAGSDKATMIDPPGYVAPPLHGVWATAPYFHNGSVPNLLGVLNPTERPAVWRRDGIQLDPKNIGLRHLAFDELPATATTASEKREYYDTRATGKSAAGHAFGAKLTAEEQRELLEYLKTL
jgi:hypothetical protein